MRKEKDMELTFVVVMAKTNANDIMETGMHWEQTHTDQILSFYGNYPNNRKMPCIKTLITRASAQYGTETSKRQKETYIFKVFKRNKDPKSSNWKAYVTNGRKNQRAQSKSRITLPRTWFNSPKSSQTISIYEKTDINCKGAVETEE